MSSPPQSKTSTLRQFIAQSVADMRVFRFPPPSDDDTDTATPASEVTCMVHPVTSRTSLRHARMQAAGAPPSRTDLQPRCRCRTKRCILPAHVYTVAAAGARASRTRDPRHRIGDIF